MADSQKALEAVVIPAAPARPEDYDTATRAALDHIDRQAVRTVADGRPESTCGALAQDWASWSKLCAASEVPGDIVTRAGERAGIEIRFTGHSPRRGLATSSRLKCHDQIVIAKQGGWAPHSKVLAGYLELVDQWEDNAPLGVL